MDKLDGMNASRKYVKQPGAPGTAWVDRMVTPTIFIGRTNPLTGKPFGKKIAKGLGIPYLKEAAPMRDHLVDKIREEKAKASKEQGRASRAYQLNEDYALELGEQFRGVEPVKWKETLGGWRGRRT